MRRQGKVSLVDDHDEALSQQSQKAMAFFMEPKEGDMARSARILQKTI